MDAIDQILLFHVILFTIILVWLVLVGIVTYKYIKSNISVTSKSTFEWDLKNVIKFTTDSPLGIVILLTIVFFGIIYFADNNIYYPKYQILINNRKDLCKDTLNLHKEVNLLKNELMNTPKRIRLKLKLRKEHEITSRYNLTIKIVNDRHEIVISEFKVNTDPVITKSEKYQFIDVFLDGSLYDKIIREIKFETHLTQRDRYNRSKLLPTMSVWASTEELNVRNIPKEVKISSGDQQIESDQRIISLIKL